MSEANRTLGNNTDFASAGFSSGAKSDTIVNKYRLQSYIGSVVGSEYRTSWCMKHRVSPTVEVRYLNNRAWYAGLMRCGSPWLCPLCAAKIAAARVDELSQLLHNLSATALPFLLTYTASHDRQTRLAEMLSRMSESFRGMKSGRKWQDIKEEFQMIGSVRTLEITWGPDSGWHPHYHEILLCDADVLLPDMKAFDPKKWPEGYQPQPLTLDEFSDGLEQQLLNYFWKSALEKNGLFCNQHGTTVEAGGARLAAYITKWGNDYKVGAAVHQVTQQDSSYDGLAREANLGQFKAGRGIERYSFFGLAAAVESGKYPAALLREYAAATRGMSVLRWSKGLRELAGLNDLSDDDAAEREPDDFDVLAILSEDDWRAVLRADARGELLTVASAGDYAAVAEWLARLHAGQTG